MSTAAPVLALDSVSKRFGNVIAVAALTESIAAGEYFCILGPSGCGKTTLLRLIAGFEQPTAGQILLDGRSLAAIPPERRDINIVFQSYALFPHMTVFENVAFGLRARSESVATIRTRVDEVLSLVRLREQAGRLPRELSGGQQQRVALARALVMKPRVLLLDEPLSALDRHLRLAMQEELRRIHTETGLTFVHITHDQSEALALGNRVAVMRAGQFVQVAAPDTLYRRPAHRYVAEFVGASNVFDAQIESVDPPLVRVGDVVLRVASVPAVRDKHAVVSVRPEAVQVEMSAHATNVFRARLRSVAFAGATFELALTVGGHDWIAHVPARGSIDRFKSGAELMVSVDPQDIAVISDHA